MPKKLTKEKIIEKANELHCNKYDYSLINTDIKSCDVIKIICPNHGIFSLKASRHYNEGQGCKFCSKRGRKKTSIEELHKKLKIFKYNYILEEDYKNQHSKIKAMCKKHGDFYISIAHAIEGRKCPKCSKQSSYNFINKAVLKFDYTYREHENPLNIYFTCKKHGEFYQRRQTHLNTKIPCKFCKKEKEIKNNIDKAKKIHKEIYDYCLVDYFSNNKQTIICKIHGGFSMKLNNHISNKQGCPECAKLIKGWSKTAFKKACIKNNNGLGIFYILKCFNDQEEFYKLRNYL